MITPALFTPTPVLSPMLPPGDEPYTPLYEATTGGVALSDGSQGRRVQRWSVAYEGGSLLVADEAGAVQLTLPTPGVLTCSLAFDNNCRPAIAYTTAAGAFMHYYDTVTAGYIDRLFGAEITSCRVCVDDTRDEANADSDVIFAYILGGHLYYRRQRDRYDIEYPVGPAESGVLTRVGMSLGYRLTFIINPRL